MRGGMRGGMRRGSGMRGAAGHCIRGGVRRGGMRGAAGDAEESRNSDLRRKRRLRSRNLKS